MNLKNLPPYTLIDITEYFLPTLYLDQPFTVKIHPDLLNPILYLNELLKKEGTTQIHTLGILNRRFIKGTNFWSSHAWAKAIDISGIQKENISTLILDPSKPCSVGLMIQKMSKQAGFPTILYGTKDHLNHIHLNVPYDLNASPKLPSEWTVVKYKPS